MIDRTAFGMTWNMPLPNGRAGARQRCDADRPPHARRPGGVIRCVSSRSADRFAGLVQHGPPPRPRGGGAVRRRGRPLGRAEVDSRLRPGRRRHPGAARGRVAARAGARGRRRLLRDPRVQLVRPGRAQERARLGLPPLASNAFRSKPVAVIGSSAGAFGGVWAAAELRKVLGAMGARVTDVELAVGHAHEKFDESGNLVDDDVREPCATRWRPCSRGRARSPPPPRPSRLLRPRRLRLPRAAAGRPSATARRRACLPRSPAPARSRVPRETRTHRSSAVVDSSVAFGGSAIEPSAVVAGRARAPRPRARASCA